MRSTIEKLEDLFVELIQQEKEIDSEIERIEDILSSTNDKTERINDVLRRRYNTSKNLKREIEAVSELIEKLRAK